MLCAECQNEVTGRVLRDNDRAFCSIVCWKGKPAPPLSADRKTREAVRTHERSPHKPGNGYADVLRNEKNAIKCRRRRDTLKRNGGSHTEAEWHALRQHYGGRCAKCGHEGALTKDHIIPVARGGTDFITNLQPLCMHCNREKAQRRSSTVPNL
jgi:5-methylcytosine-specific restriction endonuclease McrA